MGAMISNPFIIQTYTSEDEFCNRIKETERIIESIDNNRNLTIISQRRLGKTALIQHVFQLLKKNDDVSFLYIDLMHTSCLNDLVSLMSKAIIGKLESKTEQILKAFGKIIKSIRPILTIDPMTGQPELEVTLTNENRPDFALEEVFNYLKTSKQKVVVAFDEFQQIGNFPEKNVEALLRSHIQTVSNCTFLYSGSQKHLLVSMFSEYSRPFYQSCEYLYLDKINSETYKEFICQKFNNHNRLISADALDQIILWTRGVTFYIQYLCNILFSTGWIQITEDQVNETMLRILNENEVVYQNYQKLLTFQQFQLLKAIAKEGVVNKPTSNEFKMKYKLPATSSIKTSLDSLINKELIYEENKGYWVYDVFFARWLERF